MNNYQKLQRRDFFKWALAAGFSTYLLDKGKSWAQNPPDAATNKADLILHNARIGYPR